MLRRSASLKRKTRLRALGKVGRRRLAANKARKATHVEWLDHCEIGPILRNRGITFVRCMGPLEFCHARKGHHRIKKAEIGTPEHEDTVARGCSLHHESYLDLLPPEQTCEIVLEAIRRRDLI